MSLPWGAEVLGHTLHIDETLISFHLRSEPGYHMVTAVYEPTGAKVEMAVRGTKGRAKRAAAAMLYALSEVNAYAGTETLD